MLAKVKSVGVLCTVVSIGLLFTYTYLRSNVATQSQIELPIVGRRHHSTQSQIELPIVKRGHLSTQTIKKSDPTRSFVVAGDFWEQFSSASRNLQNLQCWAGKVGAKVVEPYSVSSMLRTTIGPQQSKLKFSDLIDLEYWNQESVRMRNAEVVSYETFLKEATKDVIVVQLKFVKSKTRTLQAEVKQKPDKFQPREIRYKNGCSKHSKWPNNDLISQAGFNIVRKVCFNFEYGDKLTIDEFNEAIYNTHSPNSTTVYFEQWRGLAAFGRINVVNSGCSNTGIQEHMPPSPRLLKHVDRYITKYLTNSDFIAIIARIEKSKNGLSKRQGSIGYCLTKTLEHWKMFSAKKSLSKIFLSIDMGKYGSKSFKQNATIQQDFQNFFQGVYGDKWSIAEWEGSFEDTGDTTDAGYIALLQKMIVTRATCVLFVGGGSFQKHALALYQARVPEADWCIHVVPVCTQKGNLELIHA